MVHSRNRRYESRSIRELQVEVACERTKFLFEQILDVERELDVGQP